MGTNFNNSYFYIPYQNWRSRYFSLSRIFTCLIFTPAALESCNHNGWMLNSRSPPSTNTRQRNKIITKKIFSFALFRSKCGFDNRWDSCFNFHVWRQFRCLHYRRQSFLWRIFTVFSPFSYSLISEVSVNKKVKHNKFRNPLHTVSNLGEALENEMVMQLSLTSNFIYLNAL